MNTKSKQSETAATAPEAPRGFADWNHKLWCKAHQSQSVKDCDCFEPAAAKPAHTPGPWQAVFPKFEDSEGLPWIRSEIGHCIGQVCLGKNGPDGDLPEAKANARLIAAAPTLLEACKWANELLSRKYQGEIQTGYESEAIAELRAAIAAAEGQT